MDTRFIDDDFEDHSQDTPPVISAKHIQTYLDYVHEFIGSFDAPPYQPRYMTHIKNELYRMAEDYSSAPCVEKQLRACSWDYFDIMVGTVRSQEQLDYCLKNNCYYVPSRLVSETKATFIEYVALMEHTGQGDACIRYYGKVDFLSDVERCAIPVPMSRDNHEEDYLVLGVVKWNTLDQPIPVHDSYQGGPKYTNLFLLQHCNRSYQLFCIRSAQDYETCATVIAAYNHRFHPSNLHILGESFILRTMDDMFILMNDQGRTIDRFPISLYETRPSTVIKRISRLMKQWS